MSKNYFLFVAIGICLSCISASAEKASDLINIFGGLFDANKIAVLLDKRDPQRMAATGADLKSAPTLGAASSSAVAAFGLVEFAERTAPFQRSAILRSLICCD